MPTSEISASRGRTRLRTVEGRMRDTAFDDTEQVLVDGRGSVHCVRSFVCAELSRRFLKCRVGAPRCGEPGRSTRPDSGNGDLGHRGNVASLEHFHGRGNAAGAMRHLGDIEAHLDASQRSHQHQVV